MRTAWWRSGYPQKWQSVVLHPLPTGRTASCAGRRKEPQPTGGPCGRRGKRSTKPGNPLLIIPGGGKHLALPSGNLTPRHNPGKLKADISTLHKSGRLYFALTEVEKLLDSRIVIHYILSGQPHCLLRWNHRTAGRQRDEQTISSRKPHEIVDCGLVQVTQSRESYPAMTIEEKLKVGVFTRKDRTEVRTDL